jgi:hypothetical protein
VFGASIAWTIAGGFAAVALPTLRAEANLLSIHCQRRYDFKLDSAPKLKPNPDWWQAIACGRIGSCAQKTQTSPRL